jgi:hypothetical protein
MSTPRWRDPQFMRSVRDRTHAWQFSRFAKMYSEPFILTRVNVSGSVSMGTSIVFHVSDSTQAPYLVKVTSAGTLTCSCRDASINCRRLGCVCKHACFIVFRVLQIEDETFFDRLRLTEAQLSSAAFRAITGSFQCIRVAPLDSSPSTLALTTSTTTTPRFDIVTRELTECPVCYDNMSVGSILGCPSCGNGVHRRCMDRWLSTVQHATCVHCRSRVWDQYTPLVAKE